MNLTLKHPTTNKLSDPACVVISCLVGIRPGLLNNISEFVSWKERGEQLNDDDDDVEACCSKPELRKFE